MVVPPVVFLTTQPAPRTGGHFATQRCENAPMDWDGLRYVHAVQRAGSLAGAAKSLGVDKATVSRRIAALEESLGVRLFDRKPEGYALTPHGERVVATVAEVDQSVAMLEAD